MEKPKLYQQCSQMVFTVGRLCVLKRCCPTVPGYKTEGAKLFQAPFLFVEGLLSMGPTPSSFCLLVEMGLPLHIFTAYMLLELDGLFIKRHHHKDLKLTKLWLGPIQAD